MQFTSTFPLLLFALTKENAFAAPVCEDSTKRFVASGLFKNAKKKTSCAKAEKYTKKLCQFPEVRSNCPKTCDACDNGKVCTDSSVRFYAPGSYKPNKSKNCIWVAKKKTDKRCQLENVSKMCPVTCDNKCGGEPFTSYNDLKEAVTEYCNDPGAWATNEKFDKYGPIEDWDTSEIGYMSALFRNESECNPNIAKWDVSKVSDFSGMFSSASAFNEDISGWDVSSATDFSYMFDYASAFNGDISGWDTSSATNFYCMFCSTSAFNGDISGWDVSSVTDFRYMFYYASKFDRAISGWDVSSATNFSYMFSNASAFNGDISGWDVSSATNFSGMFDSTSAFNGDISGWDVSSVTDFSYMFYYASKFDQNLCTWVIKSNADVTNFCDGAISCGDC